MRRKAVYPTSAMIPTFKARMAMPTSAPRMPSAVANTMIQRGIASASAITTFRNVQSTLIVTPPCRANNRRIHYAEDALMIQQPPSRAKNASGLCVPDVAKARMSALDVRWHSSTPISSRGTMRATQWLILTVLGAAGALTLSCSKQNSSSGAVAKDTSGAAPASASTTSSASPDSILRGTVKDVSDSVLTISSPSGEVRVALMQPLKVYAREPGNLSRVTDRTFVGVTSVSQPDGSQ